MKAEQFWQEHGFSLTATGGNCTALIREATEDRKEILITTGEAQAPKTTEEKHCVYFVNGEGYIEKGIEAQNAKGALEVVNIYDGRRN